MQQPMDQSVGQRIPVPWEYLDIALDVAHIPGKYLYISLKILPCNSLWSVHTKCYIVL